MNKIGKTFDKRSLLINIILLLCSVTLCVFLAEGLARLSKGFLPIEIQIQLEADPKDSGVGHPYIGHLHSPHNDLIIQGRDFKAVHHTDGYGFRNSWPWPERSEIVILGDSLTFGYGVEDDNAWPAIIQSAFPQHKVINLGLIGAGPMQYLRVYETFGLKLKPRLLIVGLFVGNDFWDTGLFDQWLQSNFGGSYMVWRDFQRNLQTDFISSVQNILKRFSYLYKLSIVVRNIFRTKSRSEPKIVDLSNGKNIQLRPSYLVSHTRGAFPDQHEFKLVMNALERIYTLAHQQGTEVLFVFQPPKEEIYMPLIGEPDPDYGKPLRTAIKNLGYNYLDLKPAFREAARSGEQLFFEVDGHPNLEGYRLIAQKTIEHMKEEAKNYGIADIIPSSAEISSP